jgi:hypothetical protein
MARRDIPDTGDDPGPKDNLASDPTSVGLPGAPDDERSDTTRMPRIARMPEGIEVVEERMGNASAQWILEIRCECGRRWFEVKEVDNARCPRCGLLVRVQIEQPPPVRLR